MQGLLIVINNQWTECISNDKIINKNFKWYILGLIITNFSSVLDIITKLILGLILSYLGIFFFDSLRAIHALKT